MPPPRHARWWLPLGVIAVALSVLHGFHAGLFGRAPREDRSELLATPSARAPRERSREEEVPSAADVAAIFSTLSAHPRFLDWVATDHVLERVVASVVNVAEGASPATHLGFLEPPGEFVARRQGARFVADPTSYRRYDLLVAVFESLDSAAVVAAYRRLKPRLLAEYRALGYPQGSFDKTVREAAITLLEVPEASGDIDLRPRVVGYRYVDPRLEELSPAKKHLLRMGPDNVRRVKQKLRELLESLDVELAGGRADREGDNRRAALPP